MTFVVMPSYPEALSFPPFNFNERPRVRVTGRLELALGARRLDNATLTHHCNTRRQVSGKVQVACDEQ